MNPVYIVSAVILVLLILVIICKNKEHQANPIHALLPEVSRPTALEDNILRSNSCPPWKILNPQGKCVRKCYSSCNSAKAICDENNRPVVGVNNYTCQNGPGYGCGKTNDTPVMCTYIPDQSNYASSPTY